MTAASGDITRQQAAQLDHSCWSKNKNQRIKKTVAMMTVADIIFVIFHGATRLYVPTKMVQIQIFAKRKYTNLFEEI